MGAIKGVSQDDLEDILTYIYTGFVQVASDRLKSFLKAAKTLQVFDLQDCKDDMEQSGLMDIKEEPIFDTNDSVNLCQEGRGFEDSKIRVEATSGEGERMTVPAGLSDPEDIDYSEKTEQLERREDDARTEAKALVDDIICIEETFASFVSQSALQPFRVIGEFK